MQEIKVYTITEVADILKVTKRTIYNYIEAGQLKATKVGREWRIRHEDIQAFLSKGTEENYLEKIAK